LVALVQFGCLADLLTRKVVGVFVRFVLNYPNKSQIDLGGNTEKLPCVEQCQEFV
jgi:hypothetical protein